MPATSVGLGVVLDGLAVDAKGNVLIGDGDQESMVAAADCSAGCPYGLSSIVAGDIYTINLGGARLGRVSDVERG